jgi:exopolyphosphatase/guanosine-5'-triphosphate,3'-diphosphate pyrophosphatase
MRRIGIVDIGSNSIRLVIYEITDAGAYRIIDESKESARLSARSHEDGNLKETDLQDITNILRRFKLLCVAHQVSIIRMVATAAVRNASNSAWIGQQLTERTGQRVEILSGEEEGRLGFLGMINTLDLEDGFLIDIGGGSTEVSLFRKRSLVRSISFPFGAVNMMQQFGKDGNIDPQSGYAIVDMVERAAMEQSWLKSSPGLPMIGLGGTIRSLCKLDQTRRKYTFPLIHNYLMTANDVEQWLSKLSSVPFEERKNIESLAKDRADIILPGLMILQSLFHQCQASQLVVSGSGLRDGIFFETLRPDAPQFSDVLEHSVQNLLALHPAVSLSHVLQVERFAMKLFRDLRLLHALDNRVGTYLHVAALLYRIGISIHYYNYSHHTFYLMMHSRIDGLSHREIVLCALIASFRSVKRTRSMMLNYKDLVTESDFTLVAKLGSLLQLAAACDRSETQPIEEIVAQTNGRELQFNITAHKEWSIEHRELDALGKEIQKIWGIKLRIQHA